MKNKNQIDDKTKIILFIVGLINEAVGFMFNIFCMCIIGAFLLLTGIFGFTKINNRK